MNAYKILYFIRYTPKLLPKMPKCNHKSEKSLFKCKHVRGHDTTSFVKGFYEARSKLGQDAFILMYSKIHSPKNTHRRKHGSGKTFRVEHFIRTRNGKLLRICQKTFIGILNITKLRVKGVCSCHLQTGSAPVENRGGDRKTTTFLAKKEAVIQFIKQYKVVELHYCRSKNSGRQYFD